MERLIRVQSVSGYGIMEDNEKGDKPAKQLCHYYGASHQAPIPTGPTNGSVSMLGERKENERERVCVCE